MTEVRLHMAGERVVLAYNTTDTVTVAVTGLEAVLAAGGALQVPAPDGTVTVVNGRNVLYAQVTP